MTNMRLTGMVGALLALAFLIDSTGALSGAALEKACKQVTTCVRGGGNGQLCTIADGGCAPCMTFQDNGCFVMVDGKCPFGDDCSAVFSAASGASNSAGGDKNASPSPSAGENNATTPSTSAQSMNESNSDAAKGKASNAKSGSDMSVIFAIIGAAIGVIAVAVIFLTLVRRSRAAAEEDDDSELTPTPQANWNNKASTRASVDYQNYRSQPNANGTQVSTAGVISYYNQAPASSQPVHAASAANKNPSAPIARPVRTAHRAGPCGTARPPSTETMASTQYPCTIPVDHQAQPMAMAVPVERHTGIAASVPLSQTTLTAASSPPDRRDSFEF